MMYVGIDPGLSGALAVLGEEGQLIAVWDTPTVKTGKKTVYDVAEMAKILSWERDWATVTMEQAQGMPGQGITSTFRIGEGFGIWRGILAAFKMPLLTVRPSVWQRAMFKGVAIGNGTKEKSVTLAMQLFPGIDLTPGRCRTPKDGRSDAALIARYGWMISKRNACE